MKFTCNRDWIEIVGEIWWPMGLTCAQRIELRGYDIENMRDEDGNISRESIEDWVSSNSGDFSHVHDFCATIGEEVFGWNNEESKLTYLDCMFENN